MNYAEIARLQGYKAVLKNAGDSLAFLSEECLHLRMYPKLSKDEIFILTRKLADVQYNVAILKAQFDIEKEVNALQNEYKFNMRRKIDEEKYQKVIQERAEDPA